MDGRHVLFRQSGAKLSCTSGLIRASVGLLWTHLVAAQIGSDPALGGRGTEVLDAVGMAMCSSDLLDGLREAHHHWWALGDDSRHVPFRRWLG